MRSTAVCGRPCLVCSRAASADVSAAGAAPSTRRYAPVPPRESGAGPAAEPASGQCERNAARASAQSRAGRVSASVPGPPVHRGLAAGTKPYPAHTRPTTSARTVACRARPPSRRRRKRAGHADGAGTQARPRKCAGTTINRPVEGMSCGSCVGRAERARSKVEGMTCASRVGRVLQTVPCATAATAKVATEQASVRGTANLHALAAAVSAAGYSARPIGATASVDETTQRRETTRSNLRRALSIAPRSYGPSSFWRWVRTSSLADPEEPAGNNPGSVRQAPCSVRAHGLDRVGPRSAATGPRHSSSSRRRTPSAGPLQGRSGPGNAPAPRWAVAGPRPGHTAMVARGHHALRPAARCHGAIDAGPRSGDQGWRRPPRRKAGSMDRARQLARRISL